MKIPAPIERALEETGLPWTVENGGRGSHVKLRLAGRFVGVVPGDGRRSPHQRAEQRTLSQIRRAAAEIKGGGHGR